MYTVIGYRFCDFTARDGTPIRGTQIYVTREDRGVEGLVAEKYFLSTRITYQPNVGDVITILFNKYGKVADIRLA